MVLDNYKNKVPVLYTDFSIKPTLKICDMQISKYQRKFARLAWLHQTRRITNGSVASKLEIIKKKDKRATVA